MASSGLHMEMILLLTIRPNRSLALGNAVLLLLGLVCPVAAHNGAVAIAVPLEGIEIDGDLSDWPADLEIYPIRQNVDPYGPTDLRGVDLDTSADFSPEFTVGYSLEEQLVYVAVRVRDDQVRTGISLMNTDDSEIYLGTHQGGYQATYLMCPEGGSAVSSGNNPALHLLGTGNDLDLERTRSWGAVRQSGGLLTYEWGLQLLGSSLQDTLQLKAGMTLSFDVVAADRDADEGPPSWVS